MKKHVWEYIFKDEKELKKHQERLDSFNKQIDNDARGCFYFFVLAAILLFVVLFVVALICGLTQSPV